jgi:hypothetical protein
MEKYFTYNVPEKIGNCAANRKYIGSEACSKSLVKYINKTVFMSGKKKSFCGLREGRNH